MSESAFPPSDLPAFLRLCEGEWLALRSSLALAAPSPAAPQADDALAEASGDEEERWHQAERGELQIAFLTPRSDAEAGGLEIQPPQRPSRRLRFEAGGAFASEGDGGSPGVEGLWQLWPDGSLELCLRDGEREIRERLWFTQPNLRLRSSVEQRADGSPARASFSSEIRRVRRPPQA
ncbi:MAG: phycobiliprotein lyase [Synechococcaceae cyanobacterium]|nr:phycobiliprotein lyase [Synechococcaceae cyanobacterium]